MILHQWCYVGKKQLEQGIALHRAAHDDQEMVFDVKWYPFSLNPHAPKVGKDKQRHYIEKFGEERTAALQQHLSDVGQRYGINFKYGGKTGNTRDSHRLIQLGKQKSAGTASLIAEEVFKSYLELEEDITSHETLQRAGVRAGLDCDEVRAWLASSSGGPEVDLEMAEARTKHISGVPHFTISDEYGNHESRLSGANEPSHFVRVFERIKQEYEYLQELEVANK